MTTIKIDKRLNLAFPIGSGDLALRVHSEPISRDVFEKYWAPMTQAFGYAMRTAGLNAGRIAALALKETAEQAGVWGDQFDLAGKVTKPGVENGLLAEIRRRTNVLAYDEKQGWVTLPLTVATQQGKLDVDERAEVESAIVFFMLGSWAMTKTELTGLYDAAFGINGAEITSLNVTEYGRSLMTSTATAPSGPKGESSDQSSTGSLVTVSKN